MFQGARSRVRGGGVNGSVDQKLSEQTTGPGGPVLKAGHRGLDEGPAGPEDQGRSRDSGLGFGSILKSDVHQGLSWFQLSDVSGSGGGRRSGRSGPGAALVQGILSRKGPNQTRFL